MSSKVAVVKCESYDLADQAVRKAIDLLGGMEKLVGSQNNKIMIKPNLLIGKHPNKAVTTHPEVVRPLVRMVKPGSNEVVIGDSPGTWAHKKIENYLSITGYEQLAEEEGCRAIRFGKKTPVRFDVRYAGRNRVLHIEKEVLESDYVINVAKLKTHMVTMISMALKNMYGIIPGNEKQMIHAQAPEIKGFSEAVAAIWSTRKADLNIIDAVVGLEGNGPNYLGTPKKFGYIIAGTDPVAVDTVGARLMGINPQKLVLLKICEKKGLGTMKDIELLGDRLIPRKAKLPYTLIYNLWPEFQKYLLIPLTVPQPVVKSTECSRCGVCMNICPVKAIKMNKKTSLPVIDRKVCIKCFCCSELCPEGAMKMKFRWPFSLVMKK
jgi:uncharacterized protein (DUF362 family)/Pyruvate/2-oxoacid:ferredoxin oxidoreductase delta subunit